ncbi:hypothetical protein WA026_017853 [Henosepilachna vigintioctopunctata]|uniref:Peptidase S1 domain-containing protein n=1 Tax=Henosepilachna vigintioctopunctata TaxID=420089 RepID=A0AAW1TPY5_9CUCU
MENINVALIVVLLLSLSTTIKSEVNPYDLRVIGGEPCSTTTHKYIVSLVREEEPHNFCAGSLIKLNWVLSSATCLAPYQETPSSIKVLAGISTKNPLGTQSATPEKIFIDGNFTSYDIGLIFIRQPFVQQEDTDIIELVANETEGDMLTFCDKVTALGWGIPKPRKPIIPAPPFTGDLNCVELSIMADRECNDSRAWLNPLPQPAFCLFSKEKKDVCDADRGGPLICKNVLIGVVSEGKCASPRMPSLHSRVDAHLAFIKSTLEYIPPATPPEVKPKEDSKLNELEQNENQNLEEGQNVGQKDETKPGQKDDEKGEQGSKDQAGVEQKEDQTLNENGTNVVQNEGGLNEINENQNEGQKPGTDEGQTEKPKPVQRSKTNYNRPSMILFVYIILYEILKLYF